MAWVLLHTAWTFHVDSRIENQLILGSRGTQRTCQRKFSHGLLIFLYGALQLLLYITTSLMEIVLFRYNPLSPGALLAHFVTTIPYNQQPYNIFVFGLQFF